MKESSKRITFCRPSFTHTCQSNAKLAKRAKTFFKPKEQQSKVLRNPTQKALCEIKDSFAGGKMHHFTSINVRLNMLPLKIYIVGKENVENEHQK